jgi:hypothetical protein
MTIDDPAFDRVVTLREAYRVMERFVADHLDRGEVPTAVLLAYLGLSPDRRSGDPAALPDYLAAAAAVLPGAPPRPPAAGARPGPDAT